MDLAFEYLEKHSVTWRAPDQPPDNKRASRIWGFSRDAGASSFFFLGVRRYPFAYEQTIILQHDLDQKVPMLFSDMPAAARNILDIAFQEQIDSVIEPKTLGQWFSTRLQVL